MASGYWISQNPDENASVANAYRQWADEIEQYGAVDPQVVAQLQTLGDIYADYKDAKQQELTERAGAHSRLANQARLLASRLEATSQAFIEQDEASAGSVSSVTD